MDDGDAFDAAFCHAVSFKLKFLPQMRGINAFIFSGNEHGPSTQHHS